MKLSFIGPYARGRVNRSIVALLAALPVVAMPPATAPGAEKPNVVFILIDDLGWMDLNCQGNRQLVTPNINRLAKQGMRFTDAYAAAPVCSPTRAAILTGKSPARLHLTNHAPDRPGFARKDAPFISAEMLDHLPLEHVTVAERLGAAGYATCFLGKWHLCGGGRGRPELYPQRQGFDLNIGGCGFGGPPTYFDPYRNPTLKDRRKGEYLPDRLADEAVAFMRANRTRPFMLFLWNYTVHWPMEAPKALLDKYEGRKGPGFNDWRYAAMIEAMDAAAGRLMAAVDELELTGRTLVVFTSDNGGYSGVADNRPLRLGKGFLYEGGIRVPLIVRWPGVVRPASVCRVPVVSTDFYDTLIEAAGLKPKADEAPDGESLMPLLSSSGGLSREAIYFHYPNYAFHGRNRLGSAVRRGNFKLIENFDDGSVELYNLAEDVSEKRDLAAKMPQMAARLKADLEAWRKASGAMMPRRR